MPALKYHNPGLQFSLTRHTKPAPVRVSVQYDDGKSRDLEVPAKAAALLDAIVERREKPMQ